MATFDVVSQSGTKLRSIELSDEIFAAEVKEHLFWQVVKAQLANRRSGTVSTKTRSEVAGGGRKPYRQKGTGRARQGSTRSYHWVGGGTCHGPKPRDWSEATPKKVKRGALRSALSLRAGEKKLTIIDSLTLEEIKTKKVTSILSALGVSGKALLIDQNGDDRNHATEKLALSARNLQNVNVLPPGGLNVYDVLRHEHLILTEQAARGIEGALSR
jgi:large subunit ribosomal protein L4